MDFLHRSFDPWRRPDRQFPQLSQRRADQLRHELLDTVDARGGRLEVEGTSVRIVRENEPPLTADLAPLVDSLAVDDSPHAVTAHVETFLRAVMAERDPGRMSTGDIYAALRVRLVPILGLTEGQRGVVTRTKVTDFTVDTAGCAVLDTGHGVQPAELARLAGHDDVATLAAAGLRNLGGELARAQVRVDLHDLNHRRTGEYLWTLSSDNPYLGSAPLLLDELLPHWLPDLHPADGVLFAMPSTTLLLARPLTRGPDLVAGIELAAQSAREGWMAGDQPLSPLLHVWRGGAVETVTRVGDDHRLRITPPVWLLRRARGTGG